MQQVVVVNQRAPTEYEGEITGCGMFSCEVELRETYRSKWNRQFQEASDNLGQNAYNAGYALGQALARGDRVRKAKKEKAAKYTQCLYSAGYQQMAVTIQTFPVNPPKKAWNSFSAKNFGDVRKGMTKQQTAYLLQSQAFVEDETWFGTEQHYCTTGETRDMFYVLRFRDGLLIDKDVYSVGFSDVQATGHCSYFAKRGGYEPYIGR